MKIFPMKTTVLIREWIERIRLLAISDEQAAHEEQDKLAEFALKMIADGQENPQEIAKVAVEVFQLDFDRYYS